MLFDQIDFQQQCLFFTGRYDIFKIVDITDKAGCFKIMGTDKILPDTVFQLFGFSDIDDIPILVFH